MSWSDQIRATAIGLGSYSTHRRKPESEMGSLFRSKRPSRRSNGDLRIYYASDVHGSDLCWRKFLKAADFYEVSALVMGGDLTGKVVVPVVTGADGEWSATFLGDERTARTEDARAELLRAIRMNGFYPWIASAHEFAEFQNQPALRDRIFEGVMLDELERWIQLAEERLPEAGVRAYVMPGNDDPWSIDAVLGKGNSIVPCDGKIVSIGRHEMLSVAPSNPTPWNSPREMPEDGLYQLLRNLASQVERPDRAIFNIHVPPYASQLDTACELDSTLRPVMSGSQPHLIPVGSTAVRQIIEEYQPLVSLHGHIHESRGVTRIGRTVAINPGSEYNSGKIHGCIIELSDDILHTSQLVSG